MLGLSFVPAIVQVTSPTVLWFSPREQYIESLSHTDPDPTVDLFVPIHSWAQILVVCTSCETIKEARHVPFPVHVRLLTSRTLRAVVSRAYVDARYEFVVSVRVDQQTRQTPSSVSSTCYSSARCTNVHHGRVFPSWDSLCTGCWWACCTQCFCIDASCDTPLLFAFFYCITNRIPISSWYCTIYIESNLSHMARNPI